MNHTFQIRCLTTFCENATNAEELFCSVCAIERRKQPDKPIKKESILAILWEGNQQIPEEFIPREWFIKFEDVLDLCFIIDCGWVYATAGARVLIDYCWEMLCSYRGLNPNDEFDGIEDFMRSQAVPIGKSKEGASEKKGQENHPTKKEKVECNREFCTNDIDATEQFCSTCRTLLCNSLTDINTTKILYQFEGWDEGKVFDLHDGGDWDLGGKESILTSIAESQKLSPTEEFMPQEWFIKFEDVLDLCFMINSGWSNPTEDGSEIIDACWEILCLYRDLDPDDRFENLESFMNANEL